METLICRVHSAAQGKAQLPIDIRDAVISQLKQKLVEYDAALFNATFMWERAEKIIESYKKPSPN